MNGIGIRCFGLSAGAQIGGQVREMGLINSVALRIFLREVAERLNQLGGACSSLGSEIASITGLNNLPIGEIIERVGALLVQAIRMLGEEAQNRMPILGEIAEARNSIARTARAGRNARQSVCQIARSLLRTFAGMRNVGGAIASNPLFSIFPRGRSAPAAQPQPLQVDAQPRLPRGERVAQRAENIANAVAVIARRVEGMEVGILGAVRRPEVPLLALSMLTSILSQIAPVAIEGTAMLARHVTGPALQGFTAIILLGLLTHMLHPFFGREGLLDLEGVELRRRGNQIEITYAGETLTFDVSELEDDWTVFSLMNREEDGTWEFPISDRVQELAEEVGPVVDEVD